MSDLITFIGGAAVGTLVTYLVKNEEARKTAEQFIDSVGTAFTDFLHRMTPDKARQSETTERAAAQESTEPPEPIKKATRARRAAKPKKTQGEEKPMH
jgi:hypothetical protein